MGRRFTKRKNIPVSDGWSVVSHNSSGSGGSGRARNYQVEEQQEQQLLKNAQPTTLVPGLTVEKLSAEVRRMREVFEGSETGRGVRGVLEQWKKAGGDGQNVEEAVCIGIGSFSLDWGHRMRALWQLVVFWSVLEVLQQDTRPLKLYAQEPLFTPLDISFLSTLNIAVLPSGIEQHITPSTFVYSPFVDWALLLPTFLRDKNPVLYVGNEVLDEYRESEKVERETVEFCNKIGAEFLSRRKCVKLSEFEGHVNALSGMVIYLGKGKADDEG